MSTAPNKQRNLLRDTRNLEIATVVRKDVRLKGDINLHTSMKIEGEFEGSITCSGYIHIGKGAIIKADIKADVVAVEGTVTGNIYASHKAELGPTAEVHGDITTHKLKMADGVNFSGICKMLRDDGTPVTPSPAPIAPTKA
ncbi:MAG: polymer-forming cytoskeletal protein [Spirochaetes bacterium]|nr:polymer-forming cytoskeletal protein [Spirochaetota bacterium]